MGYMDWGEKAPQVFNHPAVIATNTAEDADDFDNWIWEGIKEAIRIGKEEKTNGR